MKPLSPETVIAVAPGVRVELRDEDVWLTLADSTFDSGPHALSVLELFRHPQSLGSAMAQVSKREPDPKAWMFLSAAIYQLWQAGVLQDAYATPASPAAVLAKSGIHAQARMLNDRTRTLSFLRAIRETVKPGDVVLDIGTGTGILAIEAARVGAKHVYAMEMTGLADVAAAMFAANGVSDRVTLLRGKSTHLDLPAGVKADVLVTEIIGDGPLGEGVLETVADARARLLAPAARIVPAVLTMGVVPLRMPGDLVDHYCFSSANVEHWGREYGMDFGSVQRPADPQGLTPYRLRPSEYASCAAVAKPTALSRIELATLADVSGQASADIVIQESGPVHAVAMYFDLEISPNERLSTAPPGSQTVAMTPDNHWRVLIWMRQQPLDVVAGDTINVTFAYSRGDTHLTWRRRPEGRGMVS